VLDSPAAALHRRHVIDLDRYFARIGYGGSRAPTLDTLHGIARAHVEAIPFENLDVLLGRRIELDPAALARKLVDDRRGGYCFEQNTLLLEVLTALGYHARPLSGRVRYQRPRDYVPPRTHLFVRVELDTSWIVDAGVGAMSPTCALRLDTEAPQATPHEPRRLRREGHLVFHQVLLGDAWQDVCEITLEEMPPIDREVANWFTSTHPASHFKSRLVAARALPDGGRLGLLNRELTIRGRDGQAERRVIDSPDELLGVLADQFGLVFPPGTRFACPALDWPTAP
jgi:N-hydroxyarylamine O-acetyltransferase